SPQRFRVQIRPSTFKLGDSDRVARPNLAPLHEILQPSISTADQGLGRRSPLWNTCDHEPCTSIYDRYVLHVMDCKVDPAFHDLSETSQTMRQHSSEYAVVWISRRACARRRLRHASRRAREASVVVRQALSRGSRFPQQPLYPTNPSVTMRFFTE